MTCPARILSPEGETTIDAEGPDAVRSDTGAFLASAASETGPDPTAQQALESTKLAEEAASLAEANTI